MTQISQGIFFKPLRPRSPIHVPMSGLLLEAAIRLGRKGVVHGMIPLRDSRMFRLLASMVSKAFCARGEKEQAICKEIINQAARELSKGKTNNKPPWTEYWRLKDGMRLNLAGKRRCLPNWTRNPPARNVNGSARFASLSQLDRFWKRKQCVACTQARKSCSIDGAAWIGPGPLLDWYVQRLINRFFFDVQYLPHFAPPIMYHYPTRLASLRLTRKQRHERRARLTVPIEAAHR